MFSKANLVSTLVTAIWGLGGGFLLWGIIAEPLMAGHISEGIMKDPIDPIFLAIGCLIQGFGFSSVYGGYGSGKYGASSGLRMGILIAIMIGFGEKLIDLATANIMNLHATLINGVIYLIFFGIAGLLAGLVYKKLS